MLLSKKKKVLRQRSATFLRDFCNVPERGAVNRSCLRFLVGNKNAGFWREKKRWNSQNFSGKMPKKNFALFCAYREHCTRVKLLEGMQMKTILKLLGGYIPPSPSGFGTPGNTCSIFKAISAKSKPKVLSLKLYVPVCKEYSTEKIVPYFRTVP